MRVKLQACESCGRAPVLTKRLCRRCYTQKINLGVLDRLEVAFEPLTGYNKFIFEKYLESLKKKSVDHRDLRLARQFAEHLSRHAMGPFTSWNEIFFASKSFDCYLVSQLACPILRVGRRLECLGLISPRKNEKSVERSPQFRSLGSPVKGWAVEYFADVTRTKPAQYGFAAIGAIKRWEAFLGSKSITESNETDAKAFIAIESDGKLKKAGQIISKMKMFYDWLITKSYLQSNPFKNMQRTHITKKCLKCSEERSFFAEEESICFRCKYNEHYSQKIKFLEIESQKLPEYRRHIFDLFLRYIRRYTIYSAHNNEAKIFLTFLQTEKEITVLKSWPEVVKMSAEFKNFMKPLKVIQGCPLVKAGFVLQELGVLSIREDDYELNVDEQLLSLCQSLAVPLKLYVAYLRKRKRSKKNVFAIVARIKHFHDWLAANHKVDFWLASEKMARDYLTSLQKKFIREHQPLSAFYLWAMDQRYCLSNPFEKIKSIALKENLKVCSPEQIKKIESFIHSSRSDPEAAMILALAFYWGIKIKEMSQATLEFEDQDVKIIFYRGKLSLRNTQYRRDQVLVLPKELAWLNALKERFKSQWQTKFKKIRVGLPRQPLILHRHGLHNRPLPTLTVRKIYYIAITTAAGIRIPPNVLRRSGADQYSKQNGSAILQRLGWSKTHAFKFTWMPRQYFRLPIE